MKLAQLGPGILLAATSIGASHILMSPEAGARFGYALVWLVLITHLIKYQAFACAPRYVAARDESLLDAYAAAPGPRHWAIWMGIIDMTIQAVGLIAALVGLTGAFLVSAWGGLSVTGWSLLLTGLLLALLRWGRYGSLRLLNLVLLGALAVGTIIAFAVAAPGSDLIAGLAQGLTRPRLPDGSLLLVGAILGFMPTSIAVSVWQSLWALEQQRLRGARAEHPQGPIITTADRARRLRRGLADLRLGYGLSAGLAVLFVILGAVLLHPRGLIPEGTAVATTLSELYTARLGAWMRPVFLSVAFFALFSTCYTMMDGFPRAFVAARRVLRGDPATSPDQAPTREAGYWMFLISTTLGGMILLASTPDPARLVKVVGALGLLLSPLYFGLNLWAVTRRIPDPSLRLGRIGVAFGLVGILFMLFTAGLLLWTTFVPGTHVAGSS